MKSFRTVLAASAALLALAACSSGPANDPSTGSGDSTAASEGAFPATVETAFGEVTIEEQPERIVALGWGDAEMALALGSQPVGASDWLEYGGEGVGPWAAGLYDTPPEIIATLEPSFEAIAALEPDLILDVKSSGEQDRHDMLSQIAPTVGVPAGGESYLTTTEAQVEMISTALGVPDKGEKLLAGLDAAFEEAAQAHPDWAGQTVTAATKTSEGWGAYIEGNARIRFLEKLGFALSPEIAALPAGSTGFSVDISSEQLDLLEADLIVAFPIYIETTEITEDPLWQQVPAVADGRAIVIDGDLASAYSLGSTLSIEYAIDNLVPLIEDVNG
ncbi:MAG: iron-siderophore ABC transporter substrate-binding protein [Propionibacteriaceae bacterium]